MEEGGYCDSVKEITVFGKEDPESVCVDRYWRREWEGRPTGLGCQLHLDALGKRRVRLGR